MAVPLARGDTRIPVDRVMATLVRRCGQGSCGIPAHRCEQVSRGRCCPSGGWSWRACSVGGRECGAAAGVVVAWTVGGGGGGGVADEGGRRRVGGWGV